MVAAVRPAAAVMEGGMMVINVVTTLNTCSFAVDKNKAKAGSRLQHPPQQQASQPQQRSGPPDVVPAASVAKGDRPEQSVQQLRALLAASNCRFEAVAVVLQQTLAEV